MKKQRVKTRLEVAQEYGVSRRTLYNWCKEANLKLPKRGVLLPRHQELIYQTFGTPHPTKNPRQRD